MELTDEMLAFRDESPDNLAHIFHKKSGKNWGGRNPGSIEKPAFLRSLIALVSREDTVKNTAKAFETSPAVVSAYKDGRTSLNPETGTEQKSLMEIKERSIETTRVKALNLVNEALDQITAEKLEGAKLREIASIAKDMSIVHEKMTEDRREEGTRVQVVIMTPKTRREEDMEVIEIKANA